MFSYRSKLCACFILSLLLCSGSAIAQRQIGPAPSFVSLIEYISENSDIDVYTLAFAFEDHGETCRWIYATIFFDEWANMGEQPYSASRTGGPWREIPEYMHIEIEGYYEKVQKLTALRYAFLYYCF